MAEFTIVHISPHKTMLPIRQHQAFAIISTTAALVAASTLWFVNHLNQMPGELAATIALVLLSSHYLQRQFATVHAVPDSLAWCFVGSIAGACLSATVPGFVATNAEEGRWASLMIGHSLPPSGAALGVLGISSVCVGMTRAHRHLQDAMQRVQELLLQIAFALCACYTIFHLHSAWLPPTASLVLATLTPSNGRWCTCLRQTLLVWYAWTFVVTLFATGATMIQK